MGTPSGRFKIQYPVSGTLSQDLLSIEASESVCSVSKSLFHEGKRCWALCSFSKAFNVRSNDHTGICGGETLTFCRATELAGSCWTARKDSVLHSEVPMIRLTIAFGKVRKKWCPVWLDLNG